MARTYGVKGTSKTEPIRPEVKLVNMSTYPVGALLAIWTGSRYEETVDAKTIQELYEGAPLDTELRIHTADLLCKYYKESAGEDGKDYLKVINDISRLVVKSNLPPLDAINFSFEINNGSVGWREQVVRGRLPQNFWTQSSRISDLTTMDVSMSESISHYGGEEAVKVYKETMDKIRESYRVLEELGVPVEDIRLMPQSMVHRTYWMVPYRSLASVLSKRMSWTAQASLWTPIIEDIQSELYKNCSFFASMLGIPYEVTFDREWNVVNHLLDNDNNDRYYGNDPQPCDPLWLMYKGYTMPKHTNIEMYDKMKSYYIKLWNEEICNKLGWDKSNPSKLGPYDRPQD